MRVSKILVERLVDLYDPFDQLIGHSPEAFKRDVLECDQPSDYIAVYSKRGRKYHIRRCRYFMDAFKRGDIVDPIEIDNLCSNMHILPYPVIIDGHHRLIGAVFAEAKIIRASYNGRLDLLRYLEGKRKTKPEE